MRSTGVYVGVCGFGLFLRNFSLDLDTILKLMLAFFSVPILMWMILARKEADMNCMMVVTVLTADSWAPPDPLKILGAYQVS